MGNSAINFKLEYEDIDDNRKGKKYGMATSIRERIKRPRPKSRYGKAEPGVAEGLGERKSAKKRTPPWKANRHHSKRARH
jgi:hypothetical protein